MEFDPVLVHEWLSRTAKRLPGKVALVCGDLRFTYEEIDQKSNRLARGLARLGITKGDRVVVFMENSEEAVIATYGILKAGGVFVIAESTSPAFSLSHILYNSGARALIAHKENAPVVAAALAKKERDCPVVWAGVQSSGKMPLPDGLLWDDLLENPQGGYESPRIIDVDLASLIYTSGSTGRPKGIICTHHNMVSAARSIIQYLRNEESDIILEVLPLAFDYGLYQIIMAFMFGGTVVLERSMGYLEPIIRRIESERVTGFPMVPMISAMLLKLKKIPADRLASLRYITSTGALWPASHINRIHTALPHVKIFSMYGLTECKRVGFLPPELVDRFPESVGQAMPNCEARVVDENGKAVSIGGTGELLIRGSNVMQGYWKDPETTGQVFRDGCYPADRTLHTGDWFRLRENGLLYFSGRRDDLIKSFGRRVSPREVEDLVVAMPGIAEAAVIGVPDDVNGQVVGIFVVAHKDLTLDESAVKAFCADQLEPYKVPRYVWIVPSLPRTPNGKVDKKQLKEKLACLSL